MDITSTRSSSRNTSGLGWWMLSTTVTPWSPSAARMSTTLAALVLSKPVVGSSRNMMAGDVRSAVAMDTRRFSPPLSPRVN